MDADVRKVKVSGQLFEGHGAQMIMAGFSCTHATLTAALRWVSCGVQREIGYSIRACASTSLCRWIHLLHMTLRSSIAPQPSRDSGT